MRFWRAPVTPGTVATNGRRPECGRYGIAFGRPLQQRGYVLGRGQSESVAGDTVEVLRFGTRRGRSPTITARASARFCAAYAYVNRGGRRPRGVDAHGLDAWPLDRLLDGA